MDLNVFRFKDNFVGITDPEMQLNLDETEVVWAGIRTMWSKLEETIATSKRDLCMNYLSAWYIADIHPRSIVGGIYTTGGVPLDSKSIDGVSLKYKERTVPDGMQQLLSNGYGLKALDMIMNAPDMLLIHGS